MKKLCYIFLIMLATQVISHSAGRTQTEFYKPNKIVRLVVQLGRPVAVILAEDESIIFSNIGNNEDWDVKSKNNVLHLGAKSLDANTNIIVQTDKRLYHLDLVVAANRGVFQLTYRYDSPTVTPKYDFTAKKHPKKNYLYYGFGDKELKPELVFDDGYKTFFKFNNNLDLPTIYKVMPDRTEALVASHIEKGLVVVHEVSKRFNLRLGQKVLGVINNGKLYDTYHESQTTDDSYRLIREQK